MVRRTVFEDKLLSTSTRRRESSASPDSLESCGLASVDTWCLCALMGSVTGVQARRLMVRGASLLATLFVALA